MLEHQQLYNTAKWKRLRKKFLFENPRCVMCLAMNKQSPATEVDHIVPHCGDPELFWDWDNLQALDRSCHSSKTWYETIKSPYLPKSIRPNSKDITLLFGPPCSGKTTWAKKQDCKVIDFDDIKRDISGHNPYDMPSHYMPTCIAVRNKLIKDTKGRMIIIGTLPNPKHRTDWLNKLNAKPLMMITSQHECIRRLKNSNRPNIGGQVALIKKWFELFKPLGNEGFIS